MRSAQTPTGTASPSLKYQPMGVDDLAYAIVNRLYGNRVRPYKQFIMDWNSYTEGRRRETILEEDISGTCPADVLPQIASVVHGLCERDGLACPEYLLEAKAAEETLLGGIPVDHPYCREVRDGAPDVCWQHNVFYEEDLLYSTCSVLTRLRKQL